ncbi:7-carboxy-7-deazaguanine synthase, partial [hydrothermal vent metagenome]
SGEQDATALAEWIIEDRLAVRFQIQLHKILWGDEPGH